MNRGDLYAEQGIKPEAMDYHQEVLAMLHSQSLEYADLRKRVG